MRFKSSFIIILFIYILNVNGSIGKMSFCLPELEQQSSIMQKISEMNSKWETKIESNENYAEIKTDNGYITPAAIMVWSNITIAESFLFPNVSSEVESFERITNLLEKWQYSNDSVFVMSDYILKETLDRVGINNESVPKHFYKVVLKLCDIDKEPVGFLIPHDKLNKNKNFAVTVDKVEEISSIDFLKLMNDTSNNNAEGTYEYYTW